MASIWRLYTRSLATHPLRTRMIASGSLFTLGDLIAQQGLERRGMSHDPYRTLRLAFYGSVIFAPLVNTWLSVLERVKIPNSRVGTVIAKVVLDVGLWGPTIVGVFWTATGFLEMKSWEAVQEKVSRAYLPALSKSVCVFGPSQIINFAFVPVPHRMLFTQCVGLGWNTYLSYASGLPPPTKEEMKEIGGEIRERKGMALQQIGI